MRGPEELIFQINMSTLTDFYFIVASSFKGMLLLGQFVVGHVITIFTVITQLDIEGEGASLY